MSNSNVLALLCEDIREEKSGALTFVGIFPDNIIIENAANATNPESRPLVPKISVYIRFNFPPDGELPSYEAQLVLTDGRIIGLGKIDADLVARSKEEAKTAGLPLAGITIRAGFANFAVRTPGILRVQIIYEEIVQIVGLLKISFAESAAKPSIVLPQLV